MKKYNRTEKQKMDKRVSRNNGQFDRHTGDNDTFWKQKRIGRLLHRGKLKWHRLVKAECCEERREPEGLYPERKPVVIDWQLRPRDESLILKVTLAMYPRGQKVVIWDDEEVSA